MQSNSRIEAQQAHGKFLDGDFVRIQTLAKKRWGLVLSEGKLSMIESRLNRLSAQLNCSDASELVRRACSLEDDADLLAVFDALSTNETSFNRHAPHFDILRDAEFLNSESVSRGRPIRIWSAGCSTCCEAYTIGMVLHNALSTKSPLNAKILATDFSVSALRKAQSAVYSEQALRFLSPGDVGAHFEKIEHGGDVKFRVLPHIKQLVTLGLVNLMDPWKMKGPFDAIYCCNVMIYFDAETRLQLIERFRSLLRPGGFLVLGSSEGLTVTLDGLERYQSACLRRVS